MDGLIESTKRFADFGPELEFDIDKRTSQALAKQGSIGDVGQFGQLIVVAELLGRLVHVWASVGIR